MQEHAEQRQVVGVERVARGLELRLGHFGQHRLAARGPADGLEQVARLPALVDDRVDPGDDRGDGHRGVGERGVQDDARRRRLRLDAAAERQPVRPGEVVVDEDEVGPRAVEQDLGLARRRGAADRLEPGLGFQRCLEPEPDRVMVVDDRDPDQRPARIGKHESQDRGGPRPRQ